MSRDLELLARVSYEQDFYAWTQQQAAALRSGDISALDFENLAEELDTLGRSELSALVSAYKLIAQHLLKLMIQPDKATASRETTIRRERAIVADLLEDNPGLKPKRDEAFAKAFRRGRRDAAEETGLDSSRFPSDPPSRESRSRAITGRTSRRNAVSDRPPHRQISTAMLAATAAAVTLSSAGVRGS